MATKKISALTAKGANLEATDLLEVSEYDGVSAYTSKSITGQEIIDAVNDSIGSIYTEVTVTSAQLLAIGSTPKVLVTGTAGTYFDIQKMAFEFTEGTTSYTFDDDAFAINGYTIQVGGSLINGGVNRFAVVGNMPNSVGIGGSTNAPFFNNIDQALGANLTMTTWNGTDPTLGDGTLLIKIWYQLRTFGTEL